MEVGVDSFVNRMGAHMTGMDKEEYVKFHEGAITNLEELKDMVARTKVKNIDDYQMAMKLKSALSSLFCYTFNNEKEEFDQVADLEQELGIKLAKFARGFARIKGETAHIVKYICNQPGWKYSRDDTTKIIKELLANNCLFKNKHGSFYATGLHLAVGDNVFGVSSSGKEYRRYVKTCAIQAFSCNSHWQSVLETYDKSGTFPRIPDLPDYYYETGVGDHKHSARIYCGWKEKQTILSKYML